MRASALSHKIIAYPAKGLVNRGQFHFFVPKKVNCPLSYALKRPAAHLVQSH